MSQPSAWKSYRFPLLLLLGIAVGSVLGILLGPRAAVLKPIGDLFLNLMFTVVVPLVFVTIASAVANTEGLRRLGRIIGIMLAVFAITGLVASALMLVAVKIYPPAQGVNIPLKKEALTEGMKTGDAIVNAVTQPDFANLLSKKNILPLIIFAILFGLACALCGESGKKVGQGLAALSDVSIKLVGLVMWAAPVGLCAYFANLVGVFGPDLLGSYGRAMLVYYPVSIMYFFVFFTIYAWSSGGGIAIRRFWKEMITPSLTALGTSSGVATIPSNFIAAERIGIPKDIREMVIGIGASIHTDGSCLSAVMKISFLFGIYGMPFHGVDVYLTCLVVALLSGMVMAGIPGGGFLGEMMIITLYNFPPETAFPILAILGTLVDPPATLINATGDTVTAMMIARALEGPDWMEQPAEP